MCFKQIHQLFLCLSGSSFSFDIVSWLGISALFVPPKETISCFPALLQPWTMAAIWPSVAPKFDQGLCDLMIFSPISRKPELELPACIARGTQDGMIASPPWRGRIGCQYFIFGNWKRLRVILKTYVCFFDGSMLFSAHITDQPFSSFQLHQVNADANTKSAKNNGKQLNWTWSCFETSKVMLNANKNLEQTYKHWWLFSGASSAGQADVLQWAS